MEGQITLTEWMQWREDIRRKLQETASNFVYIGYRLKQIRDSGMFDGCSDIFEFAQKEYGLGKSITSRFIAINEKFSEGGNSLEIREEYRDLGSSKLSEMLTLSEEDCRLITAQTTVKEIREIKHFNKETPALEDAPVAAYTPLQKCIIDFFKDRKEVLNEVMYLLDDGWQAEQAAKVINPGDYITHKKGIVFLFMYDFKNGVAYKIMGQSEPVKASWDDFLNEIAKVYEDYFDEKKINKTWDKFYHVETPQNTEAKTPENRENTPVATSQQTTEKHQELPPEKAVEITENTEEKADTDHVRQEGKMADEDHIAVTGKMETEDTNATDYKMIPVDGNDDKMSPDDDSSNRYNLKRFDHGDEVSEMVPEEHIPDAAKMIPEEPIVDVGKTLEVDGKEETVMAAEPESEKKANSEWKCQIDKCFSNLQVEINAESWNAALATIKHMEHYINMAMQDEE